MNLLQAQNILVDPPKDPTPDEGKTAGPKLLLNDQMISKKYVTKVRDDMNRVKEVLSEMQIKVLEQGHKLDTEVVNETKLNITVELLERAIDERIVQNCESIKQRLVPKIKKRYKEKQIAMLL